MALNHSESVEMHHVTVYTSFGSHEWREEGLELVALGR